MLLFNRTQISGGHGQIGFALRYPFQGRGIIRNSFKIQLNIQAVGIVANQVVTKTMLMLSILKHSRWTLNCDDGEFVAIYHMIILKCGFSGIDTMKGISAVLSTSAFTGEKR